MNEGRIPRPSPMASLWPIDPEMVFLNHGSFGSCPKWVLEQQREIALRYEHEPIRYVVELVEGLLDRARGELAEFLNADAEGLAFVENATAGVNTVVRSLEYSTGDELLTNDHEYNACNNALRAAGERCGARVVTAHVPFPIRSAGEVLRAVLERVTERTRLVLLSHVTSPTGVVFPVKEIVRELNERGVESLVDGAHGPGMVEVDLKGLGATYYTGNCHKWMCGPKGAAFLWVREDRRGKVRPLIVSHGANSARTDRSRFRLEFDYTGTRDFSAALTAPIGIGYVASLSPTGYARGWAGVREHNRKLALAGRLLLSRRFGSSEGAPEGMIGSLGAVVIPSRPAGVKMKATRYHDSMQDELIRRHRVQAPVYHWTPVDEAGAPNPERAVRIVRIACQLYNTLEQVEYLAGALEEEIERERRECAGR